MWRTEHVSSVRRTDGSGGSPATLEASGRDLLNAFDRVLGSMPDVDSRSITGIREVVAHDYDDIDATSSPPLFETTSPASAAILGP
jgi:hypothetical protein